MGTKALTLVHPPVLSIHSNIPQSDAEMLARWLSNLAPLTQIAYHVDIQAFINFVRKPIREITEGDIQSFKVAMSQGTISTQERPPATSTQARKVSAIKSLFKKAEQVEYTKNIAETVPVPKVKDSLAERILDKDEAQSLYREERLGRYKGLPRRNRVLLRLTYQAGLRVSEVCRLKSRDLQPNGESGQITVFGKGGKTRVILLKASVWKDVLLFRSTDPEAYLFRSREGENRPLHPSQVHRIVKIAAANAGLSSKISCHFLRHSHVSHALDAKVPPHVVRQTVGHASLTTTTRYAHAKPTESSCLALEG